MQRFFGTSKPKESSAARLDKAVDSLQSRVEGSEAEIARIDQKLLELRDKMRDAPPGFKATLLRQATTLARQKKIYEKQAQSGDAQKLQLQQISHTVHVASQQSLSADVMRQATKEIRADLSRVRLGDIEEAQDEIRDLAAETEAIENVLGESLTTAADQDEIEEEVQALLSPEPQQPVAKLPTQQQQQPTKKQLPKPLILPD